MSDFPHVHGPSQPMGWDEDCAVCNPVRDPGDQDEDYGPGCDCTELCSMGPTCPGGMLARLSGSGCWRTDQPMSDAPIRVRVMSGRWKGRTGTLVAISEHFGNTTYPVVDLDATNRGIARQVRVRDVEGEGIRSGLTAKRAAKWITRTSREDK